MSKPTLKTRPSLPSNESAEKGILASIFHASRKVLELCAARQVNPEWFISEDHRTIYRAFLDMQSQGKPIDLLSTTEFLDSRKDELPTNGVIHTLLTEIYCETNTGSNAPYYLDLIQKTYLKREGMLESQRNYDAIFECREIQEIHDIARGAYKKVLEGCQELDTSDYDKEAMMGFLDEMEDIATGKKQMDLFPTGLPTIDRECGGLVRGELLLIRGRKGTGKSLLGQKILANNVFSERKAKAAIFTYEMPYNQYMRRLIAEQGNVSLKSMKFGQYNKGELDRFRKATSDVMQSNLRIYDVDRVKKRTPEMFFNLLRRQKKNEGLDIAMLDHLHLLKFKDSKGSKRADEELHEFSSDFKAICLELKIVGILLAQENTEGGTFGGTQVETDVDTSLCLTAVTKVIAGIKRITGTDGAFCDKCREGDLLGRKIPLVMEGEFARIFEPKD